MSERRPATAWDGLRVVLVHDWLTGRRGGERVLDAIGRVFPGADLLTLVQVPGSTTENIERRRVRRSFVNWLPAAASRYREYLPLFPSAIEQFDLDDADLVISTSHCAAKAVVAPGRAVHLCYCHSPMRYAWDQFDAYFGEGRVGWASNAILRPVLARLARWDAATAHRVTRFMANSHHVAARIRRYYNRDACVVYPPVDTLFFTPSAEPPDRHLLVVSALVPYKRLDLAIQAAARVGRPLTIVGTGPDEPRLRTLAGPTVTFAGGVSDEALRTHYRRAAALVLPGEEDFGIAPVEAMACGRPVVALGRGGASETVEDGVTGVLVGATTVDAFADGLERVTHMHVDPARVRQRALDFAPDRFDRAFRHVVTEALGSSGHAEAL